MPSDTHSSAPARWRFAQAAELRWWKRYLRGRTPASYAAWKRAYWHTFLDSIGEGHPAAEEHVLDAGCGPAGVFMVLGGCKVDAVDPLIERYERDLQHFSRASYPRVRFRAQRIEDITDADAYDRVYCLNAINHVDDIDAAMDRLVQSARHGARIYMSIDAHRFRPMKLLFRLLPFDVLHPHQYDVDEYERMFITRGCDIERRVRVRTHPLFHYMLIIARRR